ncbi:MAG: cytochrome D1 domain-containing protein [Acidobacteriota bacterium]
MHVLSAGRVVGALRRTLVVVTVLVTALVSSAAAEQRLYIHNTFSGEITKIGIPDDPSGEHEILGTIEIGHYMDYITASPDGRVIYVNRVDTLGDEGAAPNIGESGELIAIDAATDEILWRLAIEGMTHHMSVSKDGRYVFVPLWDSFWLAVVDTETRQLAKKIYTGHGGHGSKVSHDGKRLYVGSMLTDQLWVIDTESLELVDRIHFDDGVRPFALAKDDSRVFVQLSRLHGFDVVDLPSKRKAGRVMMPTLGRSFEIPEEYPHNVNHGIAVSPDGKTLLSAGSIIDIVAKFSLPDLRLQGTIDVGKDPNSIVYSKDGTFAYVSNRKEDTLSVLRVDTLEEVQRISLGKYPQRMVVIDVATP